MVVLLFVGHILVVFPVVSTAGRVLLIVVVADSAVGVVIGDG